MLKQRYEIDVRFDFRTDAGGGDPDRTSPTLRRYHQLLWSKPLPIGGALTLESPRRARYLWHESRLGQFELTSDTVIPGWVNWRKMAPVVDKMHERALDIFDRHRYTIGGMMVFPGMRRGGSTINGERGFNPKIADRFDLTLECIRRHYLAESSPIDETLERYADFFELFVDFEKYVEFFLLQDLVDARGEVRFFKTFDGFATSPLPATVQEYRAYLRRAIVFIRNRNRRVRRWSHRNLAIR